MGNRVVDLLLFRRYTDGVKTKGGSYNEHRQKVLMRNTTFGFEDLYKKMYDHIFNPILDRFHYPPNNRHYVMRYYLNGINAIVMEWLKDGCNRPIQEITEIITTCIFGLGRDYQQFI